MLDQPISAHLPQQISTFRASRANRRRVVSAILIAVAILLVSVVAYPMLPRSYIGTATVLYNPSVQDPAGEHTQIAPREVDDSLIDTQIELMQSRALSFQLINGNDLLHDPEFNTTLHPGWRDWLLGQWPGLSQRWPWLVRDPNAVVEAEVAKRFTVSRARKSYLIQVAFRSADPDKAAKLANALVNTYLANQLARKRTQQGQVLAAFDSMIAELRERYKISERNRHDFFVQSGLIHRGVKETLQLQLHDLSGQVAAAHRLSVEADARAQALLTLQKAGNLDGASEIMKSHVLEQLQERLAAVVSGANAMSLIGSSTPHIAAALREEIANQRQQIVNAAQTDAVALHNSEDQLRVEINRLDTQLIALDENERRASELSRDLDNDSHALSTALGRRAEESGRAAVVQPDAQLVAAAVAVNRPSFPTPLPYAAGSIALCLMILAAMLAPIISKRI